MGKIFGLLYVYTEAKSTFKSITLLFCNEYLIEVSQFLKVFLQLLVNTEHIILYSMICPSLCTTYFKKEYP